MVTLWVKLTCGSGSVGRALASQAEGRGFEPRLPLSLTAPSLAQAGDGALLLLKGKYIPKSLTYRQHSVGGVSKFQDFGTPHLSIMWVKIKAFMEKCDNYALHSKKLSKWKN